MRSGYGARIPSGVMPRTTSRGMIQAGGFTYRLERIAPRHYRVVRLLDDIEVGRFHTMPAVRLHPVQIDADLFRDIVRSALRAARTSAVAHAAPVPALTSDDEHGS